MEADEKKHILYMTEKHKHKLYKVDVPLEYKHTSPYEAFAKTVYLTGKNVYAIERKYEIKCNSPELEPCDIIKIFNKDWTKLS
jgi:hypothetical protein